MQRCLLHNLHELCKGTYPSSLLEINVDIKVALNLGDYPEEFHGVDTWQFRDIGVAGDFKVRQSQLAGDNGAKLVFGAVLRHAEHLAMTMPNRQSTPTRVTHMTNHDEKQSDYQEFLDATTLARVIQRNLSCTYGGYTFLRENGGEDSLTWAEMSHEACRRGQRLLANGVRRGERVALIIPDGKEFVLTFLGAISAGIVPVPMYPPMLFGKLSAYTETTACILRAADVCMLIAGSQVFEALRVLVDEVADLRYRSSDDLFSGPDIAITRPDEVVADIEVTPDDVLFLQFTSGSTSTPKGVRVTHRNLLANSVAIMVHALRAERDRDIGVSWLPMYHDMGLVGFVLAPFVLQFPVVFIPTISFARDPAIWMETISRYRATITFAPNFALALAVRETSEKMLEELDLSCLKVVGCGAEPNHPETLRRFVAHFGRAGLRPEALTPCYGMSEATLAMSFVGLGELATTDNIDSDAYHHEGMALPVSADLDPKRRLEICSCGRAVAGHRITVVDDNGKQLSDRHIGEIVFQGDSVADGYHNQPMITRQVFTDSGLRTGDLGYLVDGVLYVTGRKKDMLIVNGRNHDPQTIEWIAAEVSGVRKGNVVAFTRPGTSTEEVVLALETREANTRALMEQVRRRVQARLSLPVSEVVCLRPGFLPKTSSGKLQRGKTRQAYLDGILGQVSYRDQRRRPSVLALANHVLRFLVRPIDFLRRARGRRGRPDPRST